MARDGGITQASEHIAVAVRILDKLVKTEDPNDRSESLLAAVLNEQGVLKKAQGDEIGAKASFDRAQKLYAELSARDASNARRWLRGSQAGPGGSSAQRGFCIAEKQKYLIFVSQRQQRSLCRVY
jgi:hypothetical protein